MRYVVANSRSKVFNPYIFQVRDIFSEFRASPGIGFECDNLLCIRR